MALLAAACVVEIEVNDVSKLEVAQDVTALSATFAYELSKQPEVKLHKPAISVIRTETVVLTIASVGPDNTWGSLDGALFARPPGGAADGGQDLALGSISDLPLEAGSSQTLVFGLDRTPTNRDGLTLNQLVLDALRSDGKVQLRLEASGRGGNRGAFKADLLLDFQMGYSL